MAEEPLELDGVIGFSGARSAPLPAACAARLRGADSLCANARCTRAGKVKHALILHPDDTHIIYPLGSTIVIKNVEDKSKQIFLQGARCRRMLQRGTRIGLEAASHRCS